MDSDPIWLVLAQLEETLARDPSEVRVRLALGEAWLKAGEAGRAWEALTPLLRTELGPRAHEKIAEAEALAALSRSAPAYVRHLFDQFAADYDRRMLGPLSYVAHLVLRRLADLTLAAPARSRAILDLGCGTGLCGEAFNDLAMRLDGIDLSPGMVELARARGIYDGLSVGDVEGALGQGNGRYDLVLAADILPYLGDLAPVFSRVAEALEPSGFFLFTVEKAETGGYALGLKRRYRHSENYLRHEAARAGFEIMGLIACSPRSDNGTPIEGLAVALARV